MLKNTDYMYGVAIYTGEDTKMSMNSKMTGNKFSTVEKSMNKYLIFFMFLLFLEVFLATLLKYQVSGLCALVTLRGDTRCRSDFIFI